MNVHAYNIHDIYMQRTPFHNAAFYGRADLASYLLDKGAKVSGWAFQEIIHEGYE